MMKYEDGKYLEMTPEEVAEHEALAREAVAPQAPSESQRLEALEMAVADMMLMQIGGTIDD